MKPELLILGACVSCVFYTCANASETPTRHAELLDFTDRSFPPSDTVRTSGVMLRDFAAAVGASETSPDFVLRPRSIIAQTSLPAGRVQIPTWMRRSSSIGFVGLGSGHIASLGGCKPRPYYPSNILGRGAERRRKALYPLVHHAACEAGIPVALMDALLMQESRYNPVAISPKGAFGLGQLMPATAKQLEVDRYSLHGNLRGAARYLASQLREFGRVDHALAAYNAGPGRVRAAKGIPRITETRNYVRIVLANWGVIESNHALPQPGLATRLPGRSIWRGDFREAPATVETND